MPRTFTTHVLPLGRPQKALTSMPSASEVVWFSVSARQLTYKTYKIKSVSSLVFEKSHYYSLRFSTNSAD